MLKYALILCLAAGLSLGTLAQETNETQGNESQTPQEQQSQTPQEQPQTQQDDQTQQDNQSQNQLDSQIETRQESAAFNSVCPVDGQQVDAGIETIRYQGKEYGFDSPSCALVFSDNPELYAGNLGEGGEQFTRHELEPEDREGIEVEASEQSEMEEAESEDTESHETQSQETESQQNPEDSPTPENQQ
jgi:YHS domain-containing protein